MNAFSRWYNDNAVAAFNAKWGSALAITCPCVPVICTGTLAGGAWLYFRERSGSWAIGVGASQDAAIDHALEAQTGGA